MKFNDMILRNCTNSWMSYGMGVVSCFPDNRDYCGFVITSEELQAYASFDEENQSYPWVRLGCSNHTLSYFSASLPEVIDISENQDGTLTLTVEAVCDMVICNDAVITHELTVQFTEDGGFQYLGNEILNDGISKLPDYQYRIQ